MRGTFTCEDGTLVMLATQVYMDNMWTDLPEPMAFRTTYTLDGDILILHQDFDQMGEPPYIDWYLYR